MAGVKTRQQQKLSMCKHPSQRDQNLFKCGLCSVSFSNNKELVGHVKALSCIKPYQCGFCQVSYHTNTKLLSHVKVHKLLLFVPVSAASETSYSRGSPETGPGLVVDSLDHSKCSDNLNKNRKIKCVKIEVQETTAFATPEESICKEESECALIDSGTLNMSSQAITVAESLSDTLLNFVQHSDSRDNHDQDGNGLESTTETQPEACNQHPILSPGSSDGGHDQASISSSIQQFDTGLPDQTVEHNSEGTSLKSDRSFGFQCEECEAVFKSAPMITAHWNAQHSSCTICKESFSDPRYRHIHYKRKHDLDTVPDKPFLCAICGSQFSVARYILDHIRHKHKAKKKKKQLVVRSQSGPPKFKCGECDVLFVSMSCLSEHWRSQHSTCSDCGVSFSEPQDLYQHFVSSHSRVSDKPYWCAICGAKYPVARYVTDHIRRSHKRPKCSGHLIQSTPSCPFGENKTNAFSGSTEKEFEDDSDRHVEHRNQGKVSHANEISSHVAQGLTNKCKELDFKCGECEGIFSSAPNLSAHWKSHHSRCRICEKHFADPRDRQDHFVRKHDIDTVPSKPFLCAVCGARYPVARYLTDHIRRGHKRWNSSGQTQDDEAPQHVETGSASNGAKSGLCKLEQDAASKPVDLSYQCGECNTVFKSVPAISTHWRSKHGVCIECGECFAHPSDRHHHFISKHNIDTLPERPFLCAVCGATFGVTACLRNHVLKIHQRQEAHNQSSMRAQASPVDKDTVDHISRATADVECEDSATDSTSLNCEELNSDIIDENKYTDQTKQKEELCLFEKKDHSSTTTEVETSLPVQLPEFNHQCGECGKCFKSAPNLSDHWLSAHQECSLCGDCFYEPYELCQHQESRHKKSRVLERPFVCAICGMQTAVARYLTAHFEKRHKPKRTLQQPDKEDCSGSEFSTRESKYRYFTNESAKMQQDIESHEEGEFGAVEFQATKFYPQGDKRTVLARDKSGICPTCGKRVKDVKGHMLVHSEERPYVCTLCKKTYKTQVMLNVHMRTHTKEKPYMCDVCGQSFALQTTLTYHANRHTNARPYKCEFCGKGFNAHPGLRKHRQIHTGEKPYTCDVCGKKFIASTALKNHALTHTDLRPYSCNLCGKTFRNSGNLKYHMAHSHNKG